MKMNNLKQAGFTLLELMVVVVVIAILSAIALPSYQDYVRRGYRADAKAVLMENAQFLERNLTESNRYDRNSAGNPVTLPYTQSPREGAAKYTISITATTTSFSLAAAPVAGSTMAADACGAYVLNNLGQKQIVVSSVTNTGTLAADCWNK